MTSAGGQTSLGPIFSHARTRIQTYICENVRRVSSGDKKRESHFLFCTPHPCPEWGVSLYFEKCLPAFCVVGGIDCVRDSKVGTP